MYIPLPSAQSIMIAGLALSGTLKKPSEVSSGSVLDYAVEKCLDDDGNVRCSKPFLVAKSTCYNIEWSTEGTVSHTTLEVRDAASGEMVYYRDTNGEWTPEKGELVYLDFKPKVWKTGNDTVEYKVTTCN
ncbi:Arginine biosynthesis bifunctional protein [Venturia nashicola]|nr:Arginine biosynthesis bifunctional protein [Venturia nashicola]